MPRRIGFLAILFSIALTEQLGVLSGLLERAGFRPRACRTVRKALTVAYLENQLRVYPKPVLTPALGLLKAVLPAALVRRPLWLRTGELALEAERNEDGAKLEA